MKKYVVILFHEFDVGYNMALRQLALATEYAAKDDGHEIIYADGDGMLTWVAFDNEADMVIFKLKYMTYVLPIPEWMLVSYAHDLS